MVSRKGVKAFPCTQRVLNVHTHTLLSPYMTTSPARDRCSVPAEKNVFHIKAFGSVEELNQEVAAASAGPPGSNNAAGDVPASKANRQATDPRKKPRLNRFLLSSHFNRYQQHVSSGDSGAARTMKNRRFRVENCDG